MTNTFLKTYLFLISLLITNCWDYKNKGSDWGETCFKGDQGPIDISPPFTYKKLNITFNYNNMFTEYSLFQDGNNLNLEGDFGYIAFDDSFYISNNIQFYHPSIHSFKGNKFPLEIQIIHQDDLGNLITVCLLFKESENDYSGLLGKLGFDDRAIQNLEPGVKKAIKEPINLSKYINDEKDYFTYVSLEPVPPCTRKNAFIILTDVLNVNSNQINNFPKMIINKNRNVQPRLERNIYITIPLKDFSKKLNENKKLLKENEIRELENSALDSISASESQEDTGAVKTVPRNTVVTEDNGEEIIPYNTVKQKILAKEKYNKKTDVKLLISNKSLDETNTMIIDKDLPSNYGEIERNSLKEKFMKWKELYKEIIEGEKRGFKNNEIQKMIFLQMKNLESELKERKYQPYLNFIFRANHYKINDAPSSFIEKSVIISENSVKKKKFSKRSLLSLTPEEILKRQGQEERKVSLYNTDNLVDLEEENKISEGIGLSYEDPGFKHIFDVKTWPLECKRAQYMSPININITREELKETSFEKTLSFNLTGPIGDIFIYNDDLKIIVQSDGGFGTFTHYDHVYTVEKIFIHSPTEHTMNNKRKALELQLLAKDHFDIHTAISLLFTVGEKSPPFFDIIGFSEDTNYIYNNKIRNNERVDIKNTEYVSNGLDLSYFGNNKSETKFATYIGSTTTPPCFTNVRWFISLEEYEISPKQLELFPIGYGRYSNIRGLHEGEGRTLKYVN